MLSGISSTRKVSAILKADEANSNIESMDEGIYEKLT